MGHDLQILYRDALTTIPMETTLGYVSFAEESQGVQREQADEEVSRLTEANV